MTDAPQWIHTLGLRPHPEGGWFREVYRASETIARDALPARFTGDRSHSTAIYFLLRDGEYSALHTIKQDELWHFYDGTTLTLHTINPDGDYSAVRLGRAAEKGHVPMAVVKAGTLFGATVESSGFALTGCTVAPGFDFEDFEMPGRSSLLVRYPAHRALIERLSAEETGNTRQEGVGGPGHF